MSTATVTFTDDEEAGEGHVKISISFGEEGTNEDSTAHTLAVSSVASLMGDATDVQTSVTRVMQ